jgi:hypothetical protein
MAITVAEFYEGRLAQKQARLLLLESVYESILNGGTQSYTLTTGATTQQVTRHNIATLGLQIKLLESDIADLLNKVNGNGRTLIVRPGF